MKKLIQSLIFTTLYVFVILVCSSCENTTDGMDDMDQIIGGSDTNYTVSFDTDGGSYIAPIKVASGATISRPDDPTLDNYYFDDWYNSEKRLTRWDFDTPIVENITIYAKWSDTDVYDTSAYDFCIYTKSDLVELRNIVGNNNDKLKVILMNNIDMIGESWSPIGDSSAYPFSGEFEGNGYTISNLTIDSSNDYIGLFGYVSDATISNLRLKNPDIMGCNYTGAICGYIASGSINNCGVYGGSVIGNGEEVCYIGGVVGRADVTVTECYNISTSISILKVYSSSQSYYTGGIAGSVSTIIACTNSGNVSGIKYVGGIAGSASSVTSCYNKGEITAYYIVGGVVGSCNNVTACCNEGNVSSTNSSGNDGIAGGVIGYAGVIGTASDSTFSSMITTVVVSSAITACYNSGTVTGCQYVGGVIGYTYVSSKATATSMTYSAVSSTASLAIMGCYNTGDLIGEIGCYVGGIIGYAYSYAYSISWDITGKFYKSTTDSSITISGCYNTGAISADATNMNGIVGTSKTSSNQDTSALLYSTSKISATSCCYLPIVGEIEADIYGESSSDLVATMQSQGFYSSLNYWSGGTYWTYDADNINNNYPILLSIDYVN